MCHAATRYWDSIEASSVACQLRFYRVFANEALLQLRTDRVAFQPYGLAGGRAGGSSRNFIEIGGCRRPLAGKVTMRLPHAALITHEQAGGGGFGDPLTRDPELVRQDVLDGKISADYARLQHGVVLTDSGEIDAVATARRRPPAPTC